MKLIRDCKEIIIIYIIQFCLIVLCSIICSLFNYDVVKFMSFQFYYVMVLFYILLTIYFIKRYGISANTRKFDNYFVSVYIVVSISIILNMLFFLLGINNQSSSSLNIILLIISSGILGPIVEEFLFRRILLDRLLNRFSIRKAILIECFIFALFHTSINGFIYAFIIGLLLSIIYVKFKDIKISMLCHMVSNTFILFLSGFNIYILLLSFVCLLISLLIFYKNQLYKIG